MSGFRWPGWTDRPEVLAELEDGRVQGSRAMRYGRSVHEQEAGELLARLCGSYLLDGSELFYPDDYDAEKGSTVSLEVLGRGLPYGFQIAALPEPEAVDPVDVLDFERLPRERRRQVARALRDAGYSQAEVADLLGMRGQYQVSRLLAGTGTA